MVLGRSRTERGEYSEATPRYRGENKEKYYITFVSYVDSLDWKGTSTVESIVTRVTEKVKPGSIVLFHNDADHTPEALPIVLERLISDGYTFVKIADLIYTEGYTIDHTGKQIRNAD